MNIDEIVHPGHNHPLSLCSNVGFTSISNKEDAKCHGCNCFLVNKRNPFHTYLYECKIQGCKYFLDLHCANLKDVPQLIHPLHPQHPITPHFDFPNDHHNKIREFVCSFCQENKKSGFFYHCDECDFYLDIVCSLYFERNPVVLRKYEFEFLDDGYEKHRLSPLVIPKTRHLIECVECDKEIPYGARAFKCTGCSKSPCSFYLHPHCARKPKEMEYPFHPNHPLTTLLQMPPIDESEKLQCIACCKRIDNVFLLHCSKSDQCSNINLDIGCVFQKPAVKYQRHDHPLVYFEKIYLHDVRCSLCNLPCHENLYRCFACNFNIHPKCLLKPLKIIFDDHVHPLTLTSLLIVKDNPGKYYCDNCDKLTDPLADVYWCEHEHCLFGAHFDCIPQESITEVVEASLPQILEENLATSLSKLMLKD